MAVENHLALLRIAGVGAEPAARKPHLVALGGDRPRWVTTDSYGHLQATHLTGLHADILVLLSRHPEGLSADHLAVLLDDKDLDVVTVRAEMSRLRKVRLENLGSRPYRLLAPITSDFGEASPRARRRRTSRAPELVRRTAVHPTVPAVLARSRHPATGDRCARASRRRAPGPAPRSVGPSEGPGPGRRTTARRWYAAHCASLNCTRPVHARSGWHPAGPDHEPKDQTE